MKKLLIVNNNMHIGGVQKSLYNLLWTMAGRYDITLCLFHEAGAYMDKLPPGVKVVECGGPFRWLGMSQGECRDSLRNTLGRGALAAVSRLWGRKTAIKLMLGSQPMLPGIYDCAIAFLHNGRSRSFYGGVQEYVLRRVRAERKIAFLHCDYGQCGANYEENNRLLAEFDAIAACSDGCRKAFYEVLPELGNTCATVRNCHRFEEIRALAATDPVVYDRGRINVVMVSRLAHEKGIERAVSALARCLERGMDAALHLVGGGPMSEEIASLVRTLKTEDSVFFYGEQDNPYRYMKNADLFLMTSFHEAAPMVIEEACALGIPVLTTETTSSREMVLERDCGWVCENTQEGINEALERLLGDRCLLEAQKERMCACGGDNSAAEAQFITLIED